ncbi:MAG: uracil-DNA glycosylase [Planctomycetota bacterium]|jgi:DNA polymerase
MGRAEKLEQLKRDCLGCRRCPIGGRKIDGKLSNVFSNMKVDAKIMIVGQSPGRDEIDQEMPFIGVSGKFFDKAMQDVLGLDRSDLYITNVAKCFNNENRRPTENEISNCQSFIDAEIALVKPTCIVTLGGLALRQVTGLSGIKKHHGKVQVSLRYGCYVLPMFHPSPFNMNDDDNRKMFYKDLAQLEKYLNFDDEVEPDAVEESCYWCSRITSDPIWRDDNAFCHKNCIEDYVSYSKHSHRINEVSGNGKLRKKNHNKPHKKRYVSQHR